MTQRNPMNERYSDEKRTGKTRKSSATAKPKAARAATVRDPAPKSKKQKKAEARERERQASMKSNVVGTAFESTDAYKRLRRIWWGTLIGAVLCTVLSIALQRIDGAQTYSVAAMILAYVLIIVAFYIDLGKIRKERRLHNEALASNKSKAARKEQKRARAEMREQEKEAKEKFEAAQAEEQRKKENGFFARFRKKNQDASDSQPEGEEAQGGEKA